MSPPQAWTRKHPEVQLLKTRPSRASSCLIGRNERGRSRETIVSSDRTNHEPEAPQVGSYRRRRFRLRITSYLAAAGRGRLNWEFEITRPKGDSGILGDVGEVQRLTCWLNLLSVASWESTSQDQRSGL